MASDAQGIPLCIGDTGIYWRHCGQRGTHVAHALDAASVAARLREIEQTLDEVSRQGLGIASQARAVSIVLGLGLADA